MATRRSLLASAAVAPILVSAGMAASRAAQEATPSPTVEITMEKDLVYGEVADQELLLDVYRPPARETPRPAVILIHGGGWSFGSRFDMALPARKLAEAGYVAFNLAYRLLFVRSDGEGENLWPTQLDDVQRAVRWVRANAATYGVDPERIAAYGHSAGGHLAAMLGVRETRDTNDPALAGYSSRVTCVVVLAGDMDLTLPYPGEYDNQLVRDLVGGETDEEIEAGLHDASPITWIDDETVPFLLIHSANDEITPAAHARTMAAALHQAGVETVHVELAGGSHMIPAGWPISGPWVLTFLGVQLRLDT
jgi:acetyl esterase/lipase